jgi:tetratricopeptide (TPR) repeat protein
VNPQAYDLYQRARYRAFSNNREALAAAIELLEQAIRLDPNLAPAHALLARAYATEAFLGRPQGPELEPKALEAVSRALRLDPDLADAYLARGLVLWTHRNGFPHERAIQEIKRALELDPNLAEAHHWLGTIFNHVGLLDRGEQSLRTALRLDPTNIGIRYRIAATLLFQGKPEQALPDLEATRAFFPANAAYHIASAMFQLGRKEEATRVIEEYLRVNPRDEGGVAHAMRALLHADAGETALAEQSIAAAVKSGTGFGHFHHAAYTIGAAYASMNRSKEAVRWLRAAADDGYPCYPVFERDRALDKVRADPDFVQLMRDLRSRWERFRASS